MEKYNVIFNNASEEWQVEMDAQTIDLLATHKPIIDGKNGVTAYMISGFRYDMEEDRFIFLLTELN